MIQKMDEKYPANILNTIMLEGMKGFKSREIREDIRRSIF